MIVRFGYVAMSTLVANASPSKTMTVAYFKKLSDREAAVRKLERIASENLHNTLRLLKHNKAYDIMVYRLSSKLIPLFGHELLKDWRPIKALQESFQAIGEYSRKYGMRLSFHPDHFTVLSTPRKEVLEHSQQDLGRHVSMLHAMGLGEESKCNIHIGGMYGDKQKSGERFVRQFGALPWEIRRHITLENDDKTYTALETLEIAEQVGTPMVLHLHHHTVNNPGGESPEELWPRIAKTWEGQPLIPFAPSLSAFAALSGEEKVPLPPKIHLSSPKSEKDALSHADFVGVEPLLPFLKAIAPATPRLDIMIEAKMKDQALLKLMEDLQREGIRAAGQAAVEIPG